MTAIPVNRSGLTGGKARNALFSAAFSEVTLSFSPSPAATVSTVTVNGGEFLVAKVTANTTLTVVGAPDTAFADVIIEAGGGGGGPSGGLSGNGRGGGGAGGAVQKTLPITNTSYPIVIGAGGATATNGANSTGFSETAVGGGKGAGTDTPAGSGGCGGGGGNNPNALLPAGSGTTGQGYPGYNSRSDNSAAGGGGGGVSGGIPSAKTSYGGGGLSIVWPNSAPYDQIGGGGNGQETVYPAPAQFGGGDKNVAGTANTGGGGGYNASGGSGVVYIRVRRFQ